MNTLINKSKLHMAASAFAIAAMALSLVPMQAFATRTAEVPTGTLEKNTQVDICHENSGASAFSVVQAKAEDIVTLSSNGHPPDSNHDGDIIPPFQYDFGAGVQTYTGRNWGTGESVFRNNCTPVVTTGTLTVTKVISGIQGIAANLFGYSINNAASVAFESDGSNSQTVNLGAYTVVESGVTNNQITVGQNTYNVSYSGCSGTLTTTPALCTITNTYVPPAPVLCTDVTANNVGQPLPCTYTDLCPDIPGNQADTTLCPTTPQTCTVVITSDTADYVIEKSANAQLLTFIHGNWTAMFGPASWIWGDNPVVDPTVAETQTFRKQFGFVGTVTSATLEVASDNTHTATLNTGTANAGGSTFNAPVSYNVAADVAQGNNTLAIAVTNTAVTGSTPTDNPAGLKYRLTIQGTPTTDADCSVPFVPPVTDVCPNIDGDQATVPDGQVIVNNQCVPIVNGCTNPLATNYNQSATPANPQSAACTFNYVSQCGENPNLLTNGDFETPAPAANSFGAGFWEIFPNITGWTTTNGIEIWDNMLNAVGGNQVVELDTTGSSAISQTFATISGATYELRFDFAARSDSASLAENNVRASVDGNALVSASTTNTNWTTYGTTFTADASTDVTLADIGASNGVGSIIDNAVLCLVRDPNEGGGGDEDTYRIQGYVWHDDNENQDWDSEFIQEQETEQKTEDPLAGWTVNITDGKTTLSTTTDSGGYYYFEVPAGTWTITEVVQDGWGRTTQESHVVTVPAAPVVTLLDSIVNFVIPTAHAAVLGTYGDYDFGNNETRRGGGGGGGNRAGDRDGEVLGDSDSVTPEPLVLGEQTSVVPTGAPNTGKGGTATVVMGQFLALPRRRN